MIQKAGWPCPLPVAAATNKACGAESVAADALAPGRPERLVSAVRGPHELAAWGRTAVSPPSRVRVGGPSPGLSGAISPSRLHTRLRLCGRAISCALHDSS